MKTLGHTMEGAPSRTPYRLIATQVSRHRVAAVIAFLVVLPWLTPSHALAANILIFGLYAVGFNLLFGYTGLLSFGHAAFLGSGSYATGVVMVHYGWPWWLAIPAGITLAALIGLCMGYLVIRSRGIYFAMVTLALGQCVYFAFYKAEAITGGENGLRGVNVETIDLLGWKLDFQDPITKYFVMLVFVAAALWFVSRLLASPFGAVLESVRENEKRAAACGYDVARTKLLAFVISAAICGLAGALRALHLSIVPIDSLHYLTSGQVVMMSLLGGMGTFFGPFVGAATILWVEDVATILTKSWQLVVGVIFIIFVLFFPRGIWGSFLHWLGRR
ncbi:MAG: branched-chain amino acid ABC transporter permease [Betaproteobacteria bacterium HGW-Betaproteobacteria-14]|nr:MAG: branched-chain amino acid ABC transporter permease [Betaproteobacteria bacterium HGW-Betaproteobacteria-14]